jgi:hypothetical protein
VVSVAVTSYALRPLLPPAGRRLTEAEVDEETLRSLGLHGELDVRRPTSPRRQAQVIPFPRGPRDPNLVVDVDERHYRDPVVAARLRAVLEPGRRRVDRSAATPAERLLGVGASGRSTPSQPYPWWAGEQDRRRVRHTDAAQPPGGARVGAGRDKESAPMQPFDMEVTLGDHPLAMPPAGEPSDGGSTEATRVVRGPDELEGSPPSDADLDRLAGGAPPPRSKVVPFIPRQAPRDLAHDEAEVDPAIVAALTATVRELLFCANVGEFLHGFALYSDRHLFRFMDDTGLTVDEFRAAFEGGTARPADDWTRLSQLGDVRRLDDGRVTAVVTYLDGDRPGGSERYSFEFDAASGHWLIDDITQIEMRDLP